MSKLAAIDLDLMETIFSQLERQGTQYGYGVKAPKPDYLKTDSHLIKSIDCSGFSRYILAKCSNQQLIIPDGSQAQREWMEKSGVHQLAHYSDVQYGDPSRLFICFIKPNTNGCSDVGHVWFCRRLDAQAESTTLESHGGGGCTSRHWNYRTLIREAYSAFEINE